MKAWRVALGFREKALLGVTGSCLLLLLLVRFLYLPLIAKINERRATLKDLRVKIADAHVLTGQLAQHKATADAARERYRALEHRIAGGQSVAKILEALSLQAKQHRLELAATQPRAEDGEPNLVALGPEVILRGIPLTLQVSGRYRQLGAFLGMLPGSPFLASVQRLVVTRPQAESAKLKADLVLAVYLAERSPTR